MSRASLAFDLLPAADVAVLLDWLHARHGIDPGVFAAHRFWRRGAGAPSGSIWIAAADFSPPDGYTCDTLGVRVCRSMPPAAKLTSVFAQRFGASATRHVVDLRPEQVQPFLRREAVILGDSPSGGYEIVRAAGRVLGIGRLTDGALRSQLPKGWTAAFSQ